jgi:class 3 adenylate cyclase
VVTLLFTDVDGSTRLLDELGDGYGEALHEHRRRLRTAFADHVHETAITANGSRSR